MNGKPIVVHVDDKIPVKEITRFGRKGFFPPFAASSVEGEIWPMIGEKIWAKLTGSYANAESGSVAWVLRHVTNDYAESLDPHAGGIDKSWTKVKEWSRREYLTFVGTKQDSYVGGGHAYTILKASEINIDGTTKKILKLRNPWGSTKWSGAHAAGTPEYKALAAHFEAEGIANEDEGGKFFITWEDMMAESNAIDVALGAESRISGVDHPEWQPRVDLDSK